MTKLFSNLANNFAEGSPKTKCKYGHDNKKIHMELDTKNFECCLEYTNVKDNLMVFKCLCCNKNYQKCLIQTYKINSQYIQYF